MEIQIESSDTFDFKNTEFLVSQTIQCKNLKTGAASSIIFQLKEKLGFIRLKYIVNGNYPTMGRIMSGVHDVD